MSQKIEVVLIVLLTISFMISGVFDSEIQRKQNYYLSQFQLLHIQFSLCTYTLENFPENTTCFNDFSGNFMRLNKDFQDYLKKYWKNLAEIIFFELGILFSCILLLYIFFKRGKNETS